MISYIKVSVRTANTVVARRFSSIGLTQSKVGIRVPRQAHLQIRRNHSNHASPESSASLGLFDTLVQAHVETLAELPEVAAALEDPAVAIESYTRAEQIFERAGGDLLVATQALLADAYQEAGMYTNAIQVLERMSKDKSTSVNVAFALAKAHFYHGDFDQSLRIVSDLLDSSQVQSSPLSRGVVLGVQGTIKLLQLNKNAHKYEQSQEVMKILSVAAKSLEPYPSAAATAYNNLGVAKIFSQQLFLDRVQNVDSAMMSFHTGLDISENELVQGRIYNNMATSLLIEEDIEDDDEMLKLASEYSRSALSIYENSTSFSESEKQAGIGRSLSLAASCYVLVDSAVTAEGLFQTAIDMKGSDPLVSIARREVYHNYAQLCKKWDKREADTARLEGISIEINDGLADGWRDKPGITSGLILPTLT